ncbi:MAG: HD domain-containing protein [Patescibacteria group bacterium]
MEADKIKQIKINVPAQHNPLLKKVLEKINESEEVKTLWTVINTNALSRDKITDHGHIHFQIVANIALKISRILKKRGLQLSIENDYGLSYDHGEIVIFLASVLHDLGMSVSREGHEEFSLFIANTLLRDLLCDLPMIEKTIIVSDTLHAIISHRKGGTPKTIEAGIVRVADALDMSEGRSRIPYEKGDINIHSISAAAIDKVEITEGNEKPIEILIYMNNSAGVFQVDDLLNGKFKGSGLENYMTFKASISGDQEKNLLGEVIHQF